MFAVTYLNFLTIQDSFRYKSSISNSFFFRQMFWSSTSLGRVAVRCCTVFDTQGFNSKREFIATQGPLPSTKDDFWRMVWEYDCRAIVMVTKCVEAQRTKCDRYWPSDMEPIFYGDLQVTIIGEDSSCHIWTITELQISMVHNTHAFCLLHSFLSIFKRLTLR